MSIVLIGLNHRTAPVEVREMLAFQEAMIEPALNALVDSRNVTEALIVSTCNRVEIVAAAPLDAATTIDRVCRFLHDFHKLPAMVHDQHLYRHADRLAVRHLFRVAASLDSMVLGEAQVLGQVKSAYTRAMQIGTVGRVLNQLLPRAFTVAKKVRTETQIGSASVSVSSVAIDLTKKIFDELSSKRVMLVGAGEMAELSARYLADEGVHQFIICNRTATRAQELSAQFGGEVIDFQDLPNQLARADIVICSTGASDYVITASDCKKALASRRNRPIFFIDISVPRNIDPAVSKLDNIFLFDIDDLENVVNNNQKQRQREADKAEGIIETEVEAFYQKFDVIEIGPMIAALKEQMTETALAEFERTRAKLGHLTPEQEEAIRQHLLSSLVNKFLHPLIVTMREGARNNGHGCDILELYQNVYNLKARMKVEEHEEV